MTPRTRLGAGIVCRVFRTTIVSSSGRAKVAPDATRHEPIARFRWGNPSANHRARWPGDCRSRFVWKTALLANGSARVRLYLSVDSLSPPRAILIWRTPNGDATD